MTKTKITFRRIGGRIVPISMGNKPPPVKSNRALQAAAVGTSVAAGALSALTLFGGGKKMIFGQTSSIALDIGASALNLSAHTGGKFKDRAKVALKGEAMNQVAGWGTFAAVAALHPATRRAGIDLAKKYGGKVAELAKAGIMKVAL